MSALLFPIDSAGVAPSLLALLKAIEFVHTQGDELAPNGHDGTEDAGVLYEHSKTLAEQIPGSVLHTITDAGHLMPWSHQEEVEAVMAEFLNALDIR